MSLCEFLRESLIFGSFKNHLSHFNKKFTAEDNFFLLKDFCDLGFYL